MGLLDNLFNNDDKKKPNKSGNNNNNNNNPLANIRKNIEQIGKPKSGMKGPGYSLGGSKPGQVYEIVLPNPGPLGIRVEQRSNNSASAIVNMVVAGSQAEAAGLQRGDVLCFAGSNGQNEMPYSMFLEMAKSSQRPLHLEARRFDAKTAAAASGGGSADAEARRRAMIAAAEAREKKHKSQTKTIKHVTKTTLLKKQQQQQQMQELSADPQSEASRLAAQAAKQGEADLAAELGYNPYEAIKKTAGQARTATATTQHGAISAPGGASAPIPTVAPPKNPTSPAEDPRFPYHEFEEALATIVSSDQTAAKAGLKISKKLIANATTKGQQTGEAGEKFRRVRLANPKIKAAIVDVPGNLPLMLSMGFELHPDDANPDESLLVFPPGFKGPSWLASALKAMEETENQLA